VGTPRITGGIHSGRAAKSIYLKAGVVGNAVDPVAFIHPTGFLEGIAFECVRRFGDIVAASDVGQAKHLVALGRKHLTQLTEFVDVVCG
jgi:hypothetical protein